VIEVALSLEFVAFNWRGLSILWRKGRELWAPSIDVVYFLRSLETAGVLPPTTPRRSIWAAARASSAVFSPLRTPRSADCISRIG
jgi:hypothetical protein